MNADTHPDSKPTVAVVFGGRSSEHSVSLVTAAGVLGAIDRDAYDVIPIGVTRTGQWVLAGDDVTGSAFLPGRLPEVAPSQTGVLMPLSTEERELVLLEPGHPPQALGEVDVVFPLLHGPFGEDGTLQGLLELADVRYVGSGVLASAAMMDKHYMKVLFAGHGLPIGPYTVITDKLWRRDPQACLAAARSLRFPVFVKPARAGSSMGITKVDDPALLEEAVEFARTHDPKVVVEAGIQGREIECAVLEGRGADPARASEPGEIEVTQGHEFYDFEAKYLAADSDVRLSCPADLPDEARQQVKDLAVRAFDAAGCEGLARVDFFYTPDGAVILNEINTMPGFTPVSMFPRMWAESGLPYRELITELIELARERRVGLR